MLFRIFPALVTEIPDKQSHVFVNGQFIVTLGNYSQGTKETVILGCNKEVEKQKAKKG